MIYSLLYQLSDLERRRLIQSFNLSSIKIKRILMDILKIIFAIILPPLGVFLEVGIKGAFWLNILLTILGFIPGIIHAVWVIAKN